MSSQSGEFSCVEMSWEESSTKCKNYYGIVEEPRDERIIPIKIDRSISIHTTSDEEEEPFWVVESVKKHEEVRNEIKKMKDNKSIRASLGSSCDEDEDNSLIELLKRVQKQRNDLEDILGKENHTVNKFEVNRTDNILSRSNSMLSESSTLKARSVSRLSSLEENINLDEISDNLVNELNPNNSNNCTKIKKETALISDNISKQLISNTIYNSDERKKVILSTDTLENSCEHSDDKYSKHGDRVLNRADRDSISRLPSIEECDNSLFPQKIINAFSETPKRLSLSRLPSTEYTKQDFTLEKSISPIIKQDESNKESISKLLPRYTTEEYENKLTTINNTLDDKVKPISEQNLNGSIHFSDKDDYLNNINDKAKNNYTKDLDNDKSNEFSPLHMSYTDEADFRRKSLIRQSSMISDALNAMCTEISEDNICNKQKRLSIKENNTDFKSTLKEKTDNNLLTPSIKSESTEKFSTIDEGEITDSSIRNSSISKIMYDERITQLENSSTPKLNADDASEINESYDSLPSIKNSEISINEPLGKFLHSELNQNILNDLNTKKSDSDLKIGTLYNNSHTSNDFVPSSSSNSENESFLLDKENNLNNEQHSTPESLSRDNNLAIISPKEKTSSDIESSVNDLQPKDLTNDQVLSKTERENNTNNIQIPIKEHVINNEDDMVKQSIPSLSDKENGKSPLRTHQKEVIECSASNNNRDILPDDSHSLNVDNSKNIVEDLHPDNSIDLSLPKDIKDSNILNKHLVTKENDLNNTKTANIKAKVDKVVNEDSLNDSNEETENITKLKNLNELKEEKYDTARSGGKQIGGIQNIRC